MDSNQELSKTLIIGTYMLICLNMALWIATQAFGINTITNEWCTPISIICYIVSIWCGGLGIANNDSQAFSAQAFFGIIGLFSQIMGIYSI